MPIVDAQVHLWSKGTTLPPHRATPYLVEEALRDMAAAGVDRAVLHPPSWDVDSNELSVEAARAHPDRFAILGRFALDRPESRGLVAGWKSRPGMLGLRFTFLQPHQKSWPHDGTMDWLWPAAEQAGLPVALLAADFLPLVGEIAKRHPGLKLIVDHMAAVRGSKGDAAFINLPQLLALAKHANVAVKATGGPSYATDAYPPAACTSPTARSTMPSVRGACSGAPTSRACPAPGGSASRISPSCRGCRRPTGS
jgi:predicted TIM-barrel fold metal-dependent hydrolase